MALSHQAREYMNKCRRERYASDPAFREKERKRVEAYWERKAAEAASIKEQNDKPAEIKRG